MRSESGDGEWIPLLAAVSAAPHVRVTACHRAIGWASGAAGSASRASIFFCKSA